MSKTTFGDKALRKGVDIFLYGLFWGFLFFVLSSIFQQIDPNAISDSAKGVVPMKTFSRPFVCNAYLGLGEGTYEYYCGFLDYFLSIIGVIKIVFAFVLIGLLSFVTSLGLLAYYFLEDKYKNGYREKLIIILKKIKKAIVRFLKGFIGFFE